MLIISLDKSDFYLLAISILCGALSFFNAIVDYSLFSGVNLESKFVHGGIIKNCKRLIVFLMILFLVLA